MLKDSELKELGFKDNDELLLYKDVCAGRDTYPPETLDEFLHNMENGRTNVVTKQQYYNFIKNNGLLELLNKVKDLPIFDRMVEIYIYNINGVSLCWKMDKIYSKDLDDARESFLPGAEEEYKNKLKKIRRLHSEYFNGMLYIENEVRKRLPQEEINFYEATNNIDREVLKANDGDFSKGL